MTTIRGCCGLAAFRARSVVSSFQVCSSLFRQLTETVLPPRLQVVSISKVTDMSTQVNILKSTTRPTVRAIRLESFR